MNVNPWIKPTWTTVEMQSSRRWRIDDTSPLTGGTTLGRPTWLYARWVPPWRVWFLESSKIFSIWFRVGIYFLHRRPPFLASFSCLIPEKHRYTKTHGILSIKPLFYLYISYLCINSCLVDGLKWHLTTVNSSLVGVMPYFWLCFVSRTAHGGGVPSWCHWRPGQLRPRSSGAPRGAPSQCAGTHSGSDRARRPSGSGRCADDDPDGHRCGALGCRRLPHWGGARRL
jgi:hypothetical protein